MPPGERTIATSRDATHGVEIYTLGGFRVVVGGRVVDDHAWRRRTARQLLKVLLTRPGRRMTRDEAIELFWPQSHAGAASTNLRSTIHALRRALESSSASTELVSTDHGSVWLPLHPALWSDADAFEHLVAQAWRSQDPLPLLERASLLYEGDYLPDDLYEDWATERREGLRRAWTELQFGLARTFDSQADVSAAMEPLERLLRSDPCNEGAAQELMRLLARHHQRGEALRIYQRLVQALRHELDVDPSPESVELHRQIYTGQPLLATRPPPVVFRCAYPFPAPQALIGRASEVAALAKVISAGRAAGAVAFVGAPAGTGKSALLGEIVRQAQGDGVLCLAGGCYAERGAMPLGPFHDALLDYLLAQPPELVRTQFDSCLDDLVQVMPELRYHLQLTSDSTRSSGALDRMRAFGAIHACVRGLADRGNQVVICLEDLHAADETTLQLLHYLARQTRRLPLVLIATYRSDEAPPDKPLAQAVAAMLREGLAQRVAPVALDRDDTDRLVMALLDGRPSQALSQSVYATTGGNPLFVEQLVLALSEAGQLRRRGGLWEGIAGLEGTPQIVREVIAQRVHRLEPICRELLAVASVLGHSFEHRVLLAASESTDETALLQDLDRTIAAQVLQDTQGGYAFRHALVRDAVYWDLTAPRRMLLHGRIGVLLEGVYGTRVDDHAAELSNHFALAGESPAVRRKALRYSLIAGKRAAELSSYPESLAHFTRAWGIIEADAGLADLEIQIDALSGRGWAEANLARYPESIATYRRILALSSDPIHRGRARKVIGYSLDHTGAFRELIDECEAGLADINDTTGPDAVEIRATLLQLLGLVWYRRGRFAEVLRLGRRIEQEAPTAAHGPRMLAHKVIGWGYAGQGCMDQAIHHYELAIAEAEQWGDKPSQATSYAILGQLDYLAGRFPAAREHLARSIALYRESSNELRAALPLNTLCRVWLAEGEHERAAQQIAQALELQVGSNRFAADAHQLLGAIQVLHAEWEQARSSFERALEISERADDSASTVDALIALGSIDQYTGNWSAARTRYTDALNVASAMDPSPKRVLALRTLARLDMPRGKRDMATARLLEALTMVESMPETLELSPTLLAVAEFSLAEGRLREALALAERALENASPLEHVLDARRVLAEIRLAMHEPDAEAHANEAVTLGIRLGAPRHLSLAHLVRARSLCEHDPVKARDAFQLALDYATEARTPLERAAVLEQFGTHLLRAEDEQERALAFLQKHQPPGSEAPT